MRISATKIGFMISVAVSISLMYLTWIEFAFIEAQEKQAYDLKMTLIRGEQKASGKVVIAAIDEKSLDQFGRWPWARSVQGDLIKRLSDLGAKVITLDINYSEEDRNASLMQIGSLVKNFRKLGLLSAAQEPPDLDAMIDELNLKDDSAEKLRERLSKYGKVNESNLEFFRFLQQEEMKADTDAYLAKKITESTNVIVGYFFYLVNSQIRDLDESDYMLHDDRIAASAINTHDNPGALRLFPKALGFQPSIEVVAKASPLAGFYNMAVDEDGTVRNGPLFIEFNDMVYPSLALKSVMAFLGYQTTVEVMEYGLDAVRLQDPVSPDENYIDIPADERGMLLVNYRGGQGTHATYSIADIMSEDFPAKNIKDKIVLIGPTAIGIYDMRVTPFSTVFPGVEIHANIIDSILTKDFIKSPGILTKLVDIFTLLIIGLILGILIPRLKAGFGMLVVLAVFLGLFYFNIWAFINKGWWFHIVYPTIGLMIIYLSITIYRYFTEERERRRLKGAFQTYVSADVVTHMMDDPDRLKLGGERKVITVLFSDIRGFTTISEKLAPEDLSHILNLYLTPMTDLVFSSGGTLDKYMGDAVMAFWGAPIEYPDHTERACETALRMMEELVIIQEKFKTEGLPHIDIGIGLNTGEMAVGNMGSEVRFDYTVMGDAVNLGARLEGINKDYGTNIVISQFTRAMLSDRYFSRMLDKVSVKGKKEPVDIYELMGRDAPSDQVKQVIELYENALAVHHQRDFTKAIELFGKVLEIKPDDKASIYLIDRCKMYLEAPPTDDWDGAFVKTTK